MSDYQIAGLVLALLSLIFSGVPMVSLVYAFAVVNVIDGSQFSLLTGVFVIATLGATLVRKVSKE